MSSILTNNSAMVALQTLKSVNSNLAKTQDMISTGKDVGSAKDNAAVWAISKVMESDVGGFKAISDSLALGESTVAVGRQAAETVTDLLKEMKGKIVAAQEENVDRSKIQTDIKELTDQIKSVTDSAQFNGLNLVNGSSTDPVNILSSLNRNASGGVTPGKIEVGRQDLSISNSSTPADFGTNAVTDTSLMSLNGSVAAGGNALVADGGSLTVEINGNTSTGTNADVSYRITLDDTTVTNGAGNTNQSLGVRVFEYTASSADSLDGIAANFEQQISTFLAATGNTDYSVSRSDGVLTISSTAGGNDDQLTVTAQSFDNGTAGTSIGGLGDLASIDVTTNATGALAAIDGLINTSIDAAAAFGSAQSRIEIQSDFVGKLTDALTSGIGSLVDANMEEASARLQALQVQQQLATQSLSIANQAPQALLSLFRG